MIKIVIGVAASLILAAMLYIFYIFNPESQPLFPKCPFLLATGYECPGCGSQRAIHSLLHFNIVEAFRYNAIILLAIPYIFMGIYIEYFGGRKQCPVIEKIFFGKRSALIVLVVIIAYWILRNIF